MTLVGIVSVIAITIIGVMFVSNLGPVGLGGGACQEQATQRDDAQAALLAVISDNTSSLLSDVGSNTGSDSDSRKAARDATFNDATARLNAALEAWGECSDISLTSD
jgi:hypothetical protein